MTTRKQNIIGISATRASAIIGLNKWKTPVLAWQEIMEKIKPGFNAERGFTLPESEDKAVFRWGHAFESSVIELAEQAQCTTIGEQEKLYRDGGDPDAFCYVDGLYQPDQNISVRTLHEGKTTFERAFNMSWGEPGTDRVPDHIQVQVQHQMMCANADENIVSVLVFPKSVDEWEDEGWTTEKSLSGDNFYISHGNEPFRINPKTWAKILAQMGYFHQYPTKSNRDVQKLLREAYDHFWKKYVLTGTPPENLDYEDIRRMFTSPKGTLVVAEDVAELMREYKNIGKEIGSGGHLKKRQNQIKEQVLNFAREKTTVADDDAQEKIVFRDGCGNKVGSFDGKTFRA